MMKNTVEIMNEGSGNSNEELKLMLKLCRFLEAVRSPSYKAATHNGYYSVR